MDGPAHRLEYAESAYKQCGRLFFSCLKIPFSGRCNAMYGQQNLFYHLVLMCGGRASAEAVYQDKRQEESDSEGAAGRRGGAGQRLVPSAKWTLKKIRGVRRDRMLIRCGHAVRRSVRQMRQRGMLRRPVDVAINMHKIGRYDRRPET